MMLTIMSIIELILIVVPCVVFPSIIAALFYDMITGTDYFGRKFLEK